MREVLFASVHPPGRVPSQRFRYEQYVDYLAEHGFRTTFAPVLRPRDTHRLRAAGTTFRRRGSRSGPCAPHAADRSPRRATTSSSSSVRRCCSESIGSSDRCRARPQSSSSTSTTRSGSTTRRRRIAPFGLKRPSKTANLIRDRRSRTWPATSTWPSTPASSTTRSSIIPTTIDTDAYVRHQPATERRPSLHRVERQHHHDPALRPSPSGLAPASPALRRGRALQGDRDARYRSRRPGYPGPRLEGGDRGHATCPSSMSA